MSMSQRSCGNGFLFVIYRFMTICYTSIWYYFAPILFKFCAYFWLLKQNKDRIGEADAEGEEVEGAGEATGGEGGEGGPGE